MQRFGIQKDRGLSWRPLRPLRAALRFESFVSRQRHSSCRAHNPKGRGNAPPLPVCAWSAQKAEGSFGFAMIKGCAVSNRRLRSNAPYLGNGGAMVPYYPLCAKRAEYREVVWVSNPCGAADSFRSSSPLTPDSFNS